MAPLPFWLDLLIVLIALAAIVAGAFRWADKAYKTTAGREPDRLEGRWLPPRMSNCLILLSAMYCVMTCVEHHGFGTGLEMFVCTWVIVAGAALSAKGY